MLFFCVTADAEVCDVKPANLALAKQKKTKECFEQLESQMAGSKKRQQQECFKQLESQMAD